MRLGELLSTRHCDWHAGRGGTPFIEVVPRQDHPAGVRCKSSRYRRIYISDELERLHSEYVWQLCDAGAHLEVDLAGHFVFVNLRRGRWLAPMRPETVYDQVAVAEAQPRCRGAGGLDAALVSSHACLGSAAVRRPRACRDAQARTRRHPDHFEPLWLGERGRRAAGAGRLAQLLRGLARLGGSAGE